MTFNVLPNMFNSLTVGFDSMFDELAKLPTSTFPPYNIEKVELVVKKGYLQQSREPMIHPRVNHKML